MHEYNLKPLTDFSQYGQPRYFQRFLPKSVPRLLVDVGAHDGVMGSNSRQLILSGWEAILIEPLPSVFQRLQENCRELPNVECLNIACSNYSGRAQLFVGNGGANTQLSTLCADEQLASNLSSVALEVPTATLTDILDQRAGSKQIGLLLVDAEGHDLEILQGLDTERFHPAVIVTEEYTNNPNKHRQKYDLLKSYGYRWCGVVGSDSIWQASEIAQEDTAVDVDANTFRGSSLPPEFASLARRTESICFFDDPPLSSGLSFEEISRAIRDGELTIIGWACIAVDQPVPPYAFLHLRHEGTGQVELLQAARILRPDVVMHFAQDGLLFSGFRAHLPMTGRAAGTYSVSLLQCNDDVCCDSGEIARLNVA